MRPLAGRQRRQEKLEKLGDDLTGWIDGPYLGPAEPEPDPEDLVAWVDTRRGTHSSGDLSRGNTLPLTAWPNGFAKFTPVTDARTRRWE